MARISKRPLLVLVAVGIVTALTAGAGAGTSAPEKGPPPNPLRSLVNSLKGKSRAAREQRLLTLAKREGQVNLYTSLNTLVLKPVEAAWDKRYPDVKLNVYRASDEDLTARVLAERKAGKSGADVIETNGTNMLILQAYKDILVPYPSSPYRASIPKEYRFRTWTADRLEKFVVAWNTNLVSSPPRSFPQLSARKWKGKLTIEPTDVDWFAALYTYFTKTRKPRMTKKRADAMFKAIAANSQIISGHTTQATLLAAGQVAVDVSGHASAIEKLQAKGAPISFRPFVTPVLERPQGVGISYRLAHKAAALLFYDWLLRPAGQKVLQANGVEPARTDFNDPAFGSHPYTVKINERPIVAHYAAWSKKYSSITGVPSG